jgi:hypothetical protein
VYEKVSGWAATVLSVKLELALAADTTAAALVLLLSPGDVRLTLFTGLGDLVRIDGSAVGAVRDRSGGRCVRNG